MTAIDGTLWFATIGDTGDDFGEVGPAGNSQIIYTMGSGTTPDVLPYGVALDPANNLWFGLGQYSTNTTATSHTEIFVGSTATGSLLTSQSPNPLESPNPSNIPGGEEPVNSNGVETFTLAIDTADKLIFATVGGNLDSDSGIYEYSYNASGTLTDKSFAVTDAPNALQSAEADYYDVSTHKLYVVDETPPTGYGEFDDVTNGILAYSASSSGALTNPVLLTNNTQFITGDGSSASSYPDGLITAVTSDSNPNGLIYFTTESYAQGAQQGNAYMTSTPQDTVWYISKTGGAGQTAHVLGNLSSTAFVNLGNYEEGLVFDPHGNGGNGTLYVSDQGTGDVVQINLASGGITVASINSTFFSNGGNTPHGLAFVDGPTLTFGTAPATYVGTASAESILPGLSLSDPSGDGIASAVVTVTGGYAGDGDVLSVGGSTSGFSVAYSGAGPTEILTISGTGSVAQYQALLQEVQFATTTANPTNGGSNTFRTINVQATDTGSAVGQGGDGGGVTSETLNLTALSKPTFSSINYTTQQAVQGGAALTLLTAPPAVTPNATITGGSVVITNAQAGDALSFTPIGSISGAYVYNVATHTGTLSLSGSDTVAHYEAALASVTYQDGGTDATAHPTRTIDFSVSNAAGAAVVTAVETVTIDHAPATVTHGVGVVEGATASAASAVDSDPDGDTLTVTAVNGSAANVNQPVNGTYGVLTMSGAADTYSYVASNTAAINAAGTGSHPTDTFTYTVSDGDGGTATETLSFSIDRPPASATHVATVVEGATTGTSAGDIDPDGDALTVTALTGGMVGTALSGTYGVLTLNANDSYSYTASDTADINAAMTGSHPTDTFTYMVSDGHGGTTAETLRISIDRRPTATTHAASLVEGASASASAGDSDPDGDILMVTALTGGTVGTPLSGAYGTLTLNANDTFSYTASSTAAINAASTGSRPVDTFTYTVSDGRGGTAQETLNFTIDRPPAVTTHNLSVVEGASASASAGDSDPDGDSLTVTALSGGMVGVALAGTYGALTLNANDTYSYTASNTAAIDAAPAGHPVDTFSYTVSDGQGGTTNETLSFSIDRAPASTTHMVTVVEGASTSASAADSDPDGDGLTVISVQGSANNVGSSIAGTYGHLTLNGDDTYSYVADNTAAINGVTTGTHATDSFTYQVSDGKGGVSSETLQFVLDRAPTSAVHTVDLSAGGSSSASTAVDTDPDGDSLTVSAVSGSANNVGVAVNGAYGVLTLTANDTYSYAASNTAAINAATAGSHPVDSFSYQVSDGRGGVTTETLDFVIERAPAALTDGDIAPNTVAEGALAGTSVGVTGSATDPDGDTVTYSLTADSSNGGFQVNSSTGAVSVLDGTKLSYADSAPGHSYAITVQASDGTLTSSQSFAIAVADVAPTIGGTIAGQATTDASTVAPFSAVSIGETGSATQQETVQVNLSDTANGVFTAASLTSSGFVADGTVAGQYDYTGTAAEDTTAIQALVFAPTAHQVAPSSTVTTTFAIAVGDGTDSASDSTTTVVATATDTAPTLGGVTTSTPISDAQTASPFSGVSVTDVDTGVTITATVTPSAVANGALSDANAATDGSSVSATTGAYTVSGTAAQVQAALEALVFTPTDHQVAPGSMVSTSFTVGLNDGHSGTASDSTTTVVATATDTAPTLGGITASTAISDAQKASPFSGVSVGDVDTGVTITATVTPSAAANGVLSDANAATDGSSVNATTGTYTVSGTATQVQAALEALVFTPTDHQVAPGSTVSTSFTVGLNDGHSGTASDSTTTVVATATDTAPTLGGVTTSTSISDAQTASPFSSVTVSDVDTGVTITATVTPSAVANGVLSDSHSATDGASVNAGTGAYTVSGTAAQVQAALEGLVFTPTDHQVAPGSTVSTSFTVGLNDGHGGTASDSTTMVVATAADTAPTLGGITTSTSISDAQTASPFSSVTVTDVDTGVTITATVTPSAVADGMLSDASAATDGSSVNAGTGAYTVSGTAAQVQAALEGLVFTPTDHQVAPGSAVSTSFTVGLNDGHGGTASNAATTVVATAADTAPTTMAQAASLPERTSTTGDALSGDASAVVNPRLAVSAVSTAADGGTVHAVSTSGATTVQGAYGVLMIAANGTYSYAASGEGETVGVAYADPFTLTVTDAYGASASETLSFTSTGSATGDANANTIVGGAGAAETLTGLGGADTLVSGSAPDTFVYTAASDSPYSTTAITYDTIEGFRSGTDKIDVHAADGGAPVELVRDGSQSFVYFDPNGSGGYLGVVKVQGAVQGGDLVTSAGVAAVDAYVYGGTTPGQVLDGSAGHTTLVSGGASSDTLVGGVGDVMYGGAGADDFVIPSAAASPGSSFDTIVGFTSGQDTLDLSGAAGGAVVLAHENGVTYVEFDPDANGDGGYQGFLVVQDNVLPSDLKLAAGTTVTSYLYGTSTAGQSETLDGTAGHLIVEAGAGTDTLLGGPSDTLYAGSGADDFVIGTLAASPTSAYDVVAGFKSGTDKLDISAVDGGHVLIQAFDGDAFVYFDTNSSGGYQGVVEVTSLIAASDLVLSSAAQANGLQIVGDTHEAATATETLAGGSETDYIYAGSGADTLYGKGGADFLVGGAGADTFAYHAISDSTPSAQDIINNFGPAKGDVIDLSVLDQTSGVTGHFVTAFDGHAGEYELVQPTAASTYWHVLGDLTGAGSADFEIAFNVTGSLTDYQSVQAHIHL